MKSHVTTAYTLPTSGRSGRPPSLAVQRDDDLRDLLRYHPAMGRARSVTYGADSHGAQVIVDAGAKPDQLRATVLALVERTKPPLGAE